MIQYKYDFKLTSKRETLVLSLHRIPNTIILAQSWVHVAASLLLKHGLLDTVTKEVGSNCSMLFKSIVQCNANCYILCSFVTYQDL